MGLSMLKKLGTEKGKPYILLNDGHKYMAIPITYLTFM